MDVTPLIPQGRQIIQAYAQGHIRVNGQMFEAPVIVFTERVIAWSVSHTADALTIDDFTVLFPESENLDVVLIGCGAKMLPIPFVLQQSLKDRGIAVEFMDTGAACRTYNVLMAEGRRVAAALFPA